MTFEMDNAATMHELVCARIEDIPVLPEGMILFERECSTCGEPVWWEPLPNVPESECRILCSRCGLPPELWDAEPDAANSGIGPTLN